MQNNKEFSVMNRNELRKMVIKRFMLFAIVLSVIFFVPAGTVYYWEAWCYMGILFFPMIFVVRYLLRHDPGLLERRMRMREKEKEQKIIIKVGYLLFTTIYLIPGLDKRYSWSSVTDTAVIIGDLIVLAGYILFIFGIRENSYASRIIEVEQNQKVISTGPYAIVRHPMYLASILMYIFSPLALGSYWGMIPTVLIIILLVARIYNEEKVLSKNLNGYREYTEKIKYRLVPGIW